MRVTTSQYEKKRQKLTFAQSKRFPPKDNLFVRENNSLEQAAFWHEVGVVCCHGTKISGSQQIEDLQIWHKNDLYTVFPVHGCSQKQNSSPHFSSIV